jgi:hypothetical protein
MLKSAFLISLSCCAISHAAELPANDALRSLKEQDQAVRVANVGSVNWSKITEEDAERRDKVTKMLGSGEVRTAEDFYNAALIFQHGRHVDDIRLAYSLASISIKLDPENGKAKWLTAASWDRIMMQLGKPQWYGTQFTKAHGAGSKWELYKIDETAVTDEERKALGVPTIAEARARIQKLNDDG